MKRHRLITTLAVLGVAVLFAVLSPRTASSPSQAPAPTVQLRAVSSSCYEFSLRDPRIPADGWRVSFHAGGSNCLTLSSFSGADGELIGIVCCTGAASPCQDQLVVTGSQAGRPVFTVTRTVNCP